MFAAVLNIIKFGYSITYLALVEGVTDQLEPKVYTGDTPAVCDAIILLWPTAAGVTVSCTILI